jgi:xanthine/CO dehydrogenase XdhC/CoxF family maturation factor
VATVYQSASSLGARLFLDEKGDVRYENLSGEMAGLIESEMRALAQDGVTSAARILDVDGVAAKVFFETLLPPVPLVLFGAGQDALPVVELARDLGWWTEVVDPQARPASRSRFALADRVTLSRPEDIGAHVTLTPRTMALLMSHNYAHDLAMLRFLLASPARYIGVLGPRKRTERMLRDLAPIEGAGLARLHAPAGLDIGANGPVEIALSIIAEMRAVLDGRRGGKLRERRGSIHGSPGDGERVTRAEERTLPWVAA